MIELSVAPGVPLAPGRRPAGRASAALALATSDRPARCRPGGQHRPARAWLEGAREPYGGYAATPGSSPSVQMTGWAMLGLEATGRTRATSAPAGAPRSTIWRRTRAGSARRTSSSSRSLRWKRRGSTRTGSRARSPRRPAPQAIGRRLLAGTGQPDRLCGARRALPAAQRGCTCGGLAEVGQNEDGGFGFGPSQPSDPDSTGAAMQGLAAAGSGGLGDTIAYLVETQRREGGWGSTKPA